LRPLDRGSLVSDPRHSATVQGDSPGSRAPLRNRLTMLGQRGPHSVARSGKKPFG
jgi:hypothetical protein